MNDFFEPILKSKTDVELIDITIDSSNYQTEFVKLAHQEIIYRNISFEFIEKYKKTKELLNRRKSSKTNQAHPFFDNKKSTKIYDIELSLNNQQKKEYFEEIVKTKSDEELIKILVNYKEYEADYIHYINTEIKSRKIESETIEKFWSEKESITNHKSKPDNLPPRIFKRVINSIFLILIFFSVVLFIGSFSDYRIIFLIGALVYLRIFRKPVINYIRHGKWDFDMY